MNAGLTHLSRWRCNRYMLTLVKNVHTSCWCKKVYRTANSSSHHGMVGSHPKGFLHHAITCSLREPQESHCSGCCEGASTNGNRTLDSPQRLSPAASSRGLPSGWDSARQANRKGGGREYECRNDDDVEVLVVDVVVHTEDILGNRAVTPEDKKIRPKCA